MASSSDSTASQSDIAQDVGIRILPVVFLAGMLSLVGIAGCQPRDSATKRSSNETPKNEPAAARSEGKDNSAAAKRAGNTGQAQRKNEPVPTRLPPAMGSKKIPSPDAICGHAIAFAGWRSGLGLEGQRLLFFDPGDNAVEAGKHSHRWVADPGESQIQFGERRPIVVLSPAEAFTVVGAVVLSPKAVAAAEEPVEQPAANMPDLSQALHDKWHGLCGPTSAADLLYAIASRRPAILAGFERGPSEQANRDSARLIAGENGKLNPDSLATHMSMAEDGGGVTNEGMRAGLETWLNNHDAESWNVGLEWLDDRKKTPDEQTKFFRTLATASQKGGGAVLCLWPGAEFSDRSTDEAAAEQASQNEAADGPKNTQGSGGAGNPNEATGRENTKNPGTAGTPSGNNSGENESQPSSPPGSDSGTADGSPTQAAGEANEGATQPAGSKKGFDGKKSTPQAAAAALDRGRRSLERARRALNDGSHGDAVDAVAIAISTLRPHAASDKECRTALREAADLAAHIEAGMPRQGPVSTKPTRFQ